MRQVNTEIRWENKGDDMKNIDALAQKKIDLSDLRQRIKGRVITQGEPDYETARTIFYGGIERRPTVIARPVDVDDISALVTLARETGTELSVRSGGHSAAGHALTDGGIMLDMRDMRALQIDAANRTAWVEAGLTTGEFTKAADAHNLATGFGDTATVGIGGLTLGGGVGYLVRKHGLTIDNLLAAEIVTADGKVHLVDADHEPDLFWAIRGGGGNFGVVSRFKLRMHEMNEVFGGMLILPATAELIAGFVGEAEAASDELSTIANIMPAPPMPFLPAELHGKLVLLGMMFYAGKADDGMKAVAPFRKLAQPYADMLRPIRYPEMFPPEEGEYHPTAVGHTMFLDEIREAEAQTIIKYLQASDAQVRVTQLRVLGGAMGRIPNEATAYAHRHRRIMANLAAFYNGPDDQAVRRAWLTNFVTALSDGKPGAYVNFLANEGEERIRSAYPGKTWDRLARIKAKYDPTNLFRLNQNVPPA